MPDTARRHDGLRHLSGTQKKVTDMKRVQSVCLFQTLVFSQKEDSGLSAAEQLKLNRSEAERYRAGLDAAKTRYQIDETCERPDGSVCGSSITTGRTSANILHNQKQSRSTWERLCFFVHSGTLL